ncbi:hypothetical protein RJ641_019809 [Dillenia turbinata]|uniref:Uncharacterized protein n=1 Tax=Dillenia turbinata TaxID=194707 RepID=A0AAN8UQD7_9MAGN
MASGYIHGHQTSSSRVVAMGLALVFATVLSPLYVRQKNEVNYESSWCPSYVLPMVLAGLIIAIKTTSSREARTTLVPSPDPSCVLRIGSSSWGLAGVLVMLMVVISWQDSVKGFLWR